MSPTNNDAYDNWKRLPPEWDEKRIAGVPRTVAQNWRAMSERMRDMATWRQNVGR